MDKAGPPWDLPEHDKDADRVAERRPEGICTPTYAQLAQKLMDQGYEPVPISPNTKKVPAIGWTTLPINEAQIDAWIDEFGHCGIGLRTGHLVAIDIDVLDADAAHEITQIAIARLGPTILRVGRWPKRLLLYRTLTPFAKLKVGKVEVLAQGQQFVAFGIHPDTRRPYDWPMGKSPLDVALDALPLVNLAMIEALLAELLPLAGAAPTGSRASDPTGQQKLSRNGDGKVVDGRDGWLSAIAFHAVHDAIDRRDITDENALAAVVWQRFADGTDLSRPKQDGRHYYEPRDALRKVRDKLRLYRHAQLLPRNKPMVVPADVPLGLPADEARRELDRLLAAAMDAIEGWHLQGGVIAAPRIGVRATVGLGKSTAARHHVAGLIARLAAAGLPHRVLNLVPSLALADETADAWRRLGIAAEVLRGYEAVNAVTREPMCLDIPAIRAAADAKLDIHSSVCFRSKSQRCTHYATCAKQTNRRAVSQAQVVVAAYDALFTGFAGDGCDIALIVVDEACLQRSLQVSQGLTIEALPFLGITSVAGASRQEALGGLMADVVAARQKLATALVCMPRGEVRADALASAGIDASFCREARDSEYAVLPNTHLSPGQGQYDRRIALERSLSRSLGLQVIDLWTALEGLLAGEVASVAKIWLEEQRNREGLRPIRIYHRKSIAAELAGLPLLHLDATMKQELASVVLPGLQMVCVTADTPHQHVRLINGSFGKGSLCPDPRAPAAENQRRANRLQDCIDYVRWHAERHTPSRVLVITYKAIEAAFTCIPGVEVAHYNAVAGLDVWGDIAALFLIGRPLPQSADLAEMTGALLDRSVEETYASAHLGVVMRSGPQCSVRAIRHTNPFAELLRAAICDDEIIQALGRGRGINRSAENPLEVHLLADVVLPVIHDRVQAWETVCPDIMQRMLIGGLAVDSPKHSWQLHPLIFATEEQARKTFSRAAFKGHFPISNIYREMSLKSASYRLGGRGRGWQRAFWIAGSTDDARLRLETAVGPVADWKPEPGGEAH